NTTGTADIDLTVAGAWANFAPAKLIGAAHLQNVSARIPGVQYPLLLSTADAQFTDAEMVLSHIAAQFGHSPIAFAGSVSKPLVCQTEPLCALQFDLHAAALATSDIATLFGLNQNRWNLPFLSSSSPGQFPDFRASGTRSLETLRIVDLPVEKFVAHLELADHALALSRISGKVGGGATQGEWRIDWGSTPVRYSGTGVMTGIASDHLLLSAPAE